MQAYLFFAAVFRPPTTHRARNWRLAALAACLGAGHWANASAAQIVSSSLPAQSSVTATVVDQVALAASAAIQPAAGGSAANYRLIEAGADRFLGTRDDFEYALAPTVSGTNVLLRFDPSPLQPGRYRFQTLAGLLDASGAGITPFEREFVLVQPAGGRIESTSNDQLEQATALPVAESPAGSKFFTALGLGAFSNNEDADYWRFEAEAGDRITVRVIADSNAQPSIQLRNAANAHVTSAGGSGGISVLQDFRIPSPGTHYLRLSANRFGTYSMSLDQSRGPQLESEPNDDNARANEGELKIRAGGYSLAYAGSLEKGDAVDIVSLGHLTAGNSVAVNALFPAGSTLPGTGMAIRLLREGAAQPEAVTGDAALNFTIAASGVHYVAIGLAGGGGPRAQYLLSVDIADAVAPAVSGISLPAEGGSTRELVQDFTVQFTEDMNPVMIKNSSNYELRNAGRDGQFNTADDQLYRVTNDDYAAGLSVRFTLPDGPLQAGSYSLRISTGINDRAGNALAAVAVRRFVVEGDAEYPSEGRNNDGFAGAAPAGSVIDLFDGSFTPILSVPAGNGAYSVDVADFNRDGNADAVVANYSSENITIMRGNGDGTFLEPVDVAVDGNPVYVKAQDLNGDQRADVMTANPGGNSITVLLANADGTFTRQKIALGGAPNAVAAGDFNGDGRLDLVTAHGSKLAIIPGSISGSFGAREEYEAGLNGPYGVAAGDLDGDGKLDVVVANTGSAKLSVLFGDGKGTFLAPVSLPVTANPRHLSLGDLDRDGDLDIVVLCASENKIDRYRNDGRGNFIGQRKSFEAQGSEGYGLTLADVNKDGGLDVLVGAYGNSRLSVLLAQPDAEFGAVAHYQISGNPISAAAADFDQDGWVDIITANYGSRNATLFRANRLVMTVPDASIGNARILSGRGRLLSIEDTDYWRFHAAPGETISLAIETGVNSSSLYIQLFRPDGQRVEGFHSTSAGNGQMRPFRATVYGTHYIAISYNHQFFGEYRWKAAISSGNLQHESENNDSTSQANAPQFAQSGSNRAASIYGFISRDDSVSGDYYALGTVAVGTPISVKLKQPSSSAFVPRIELVKGSEVVASAVNGADLNYTVPSGGDAVLHARILGANGAKPIGVGAQYLAEITMSGEATPPHVASVSLPAEGSSTSQVVHRFRVQFDEEMDSRFNSIGREFVFRGGSAYARSPDTMNWSAASAYAKSLGGTLATIESAEENDWLRQQFSVSGNFWIGLNDAAAEGTLRWESGSDSAYAQWGNNEPANSTDRDFAGFSYWGQWFMQGNANYYAVAEVPAQDSDGDRVPDAADPYPHDPANGIEVRGAGSDGAFDTADDQVFRLRSAGYTAGLNADFLIENGPLPPGQYRVRFTQALTDKAGNGLAEVFVRRFAIAPVQGHVFEGPNNDEISGATVLSPSPLSAADGSVSRGYQIATAANPYAICSADFNEDGIADLATADYSGNNVSVFLGRGDGTFLPSIFQPVGRNPIYLIAGDFNKDGHKDIATADTSAATVTILSGDGRGSFAASTHPAGSSPRWLASGDFDSDGLEDVVCANEGSANVTIVFGAAGAERRTSNHAVGNGPRTVAAADLNGDGKLDILAGNYSESALAFLAGDGLGGFAARKVTSGVPGVQVVRLADLNADGKLDCMVLNSSGASMDLFLGDGQGSFQRSKSFAYGSGGNYDFTFGDIDGDGKLDIVLPNYAQNQLTILLGKGGGLFGGAVPHQGAGNPISAVTGDFDRDGRLDVATANYSQSTMTIFFGNQAKPLPPDAALGSVRVGAGRGALLTRDDADHWSFTGEAGQTALILCETPGVTSGASLYYRLFRANGEQLTAFAASGNGLGQSQPILLPSTGTYFVLVTYNNEFTGEYRFQVLLSDPPARVEDESNNSHNQANSLNFSPIGGDRRALAVGTMTPNDPADFFALGTVPIGSPIEVNLRLGSRNAAMPKLEIFLADKPVASGANGQTALSYVVPEGGEGNYSVKVSAPGGTLSLEALYQFDVTVKTEKVPPLVRSVDLPEEGAASDAVIDRFTVKMSEEVHAQINGLNRKFSRLGNNYYILTSRSMPWLQAEAEAVTLGGHLVAVGSKAEQDWLIQNFNGQYWIGFNDREEEGTFVWSSGEPAQFTNWNSGEPNNSNDEDYAHYYANSGTWNDLPASSSLFGVIEIAGGAQNDGDGDGIVDAIDPYPADPLNAVDLRAAGADAQFGTRDDILFRVQTTGYAGGADLGFYILDSPLPPGSYRLTITRALSDLAGNGLAAPFVRHFAVTPVPPFVLEGGSNDSLRTATSLAPSSGLPNGSFIAGRTFETGKRAGAMATADFNKDGLPDIAVGNYERANVSIYLGTAAGDLEFFEDLPAGATPYYVLAADLNRDGTSDLAIANHSGNSVSILIGAGGAKFRQKLDVPVGSTPWMLALADFNRDGFPEIVSANYSSQNVTVISGASDWTSATTRNVAAGQNPRGLAVGDLNEDGFADVLVACSGEDNLALLLGNAAGGLELPRKIEAGNEPRFVELADLNGDGHLDWVVFNNAGATLDVYTGDGKGGVSKRAASSAPNLDVYQLLLTDLNADQQLDALAVSYSTSALVIWINQGGGIFGKALVHNFDGSPLSAVTGDFDRDGALDIVAGNYGRTWLTYFHGRRSEGLPQDPLLGIEIGSGRGRLLNQDDADFFTFSGKAGQVVSVVAESVGSPNGSGLYYRLFRPGGAEIANRAASSAGFANLGPVTLPADGNYYVGVSYNHLYYGEYRFRVLLAPDGSVLERETRETIPGEDLSFAAQNGPRSARVLGTILGNNDTDFFNLGSLEPGDLVTLNVQRADPAGFPMVLALTDSEGRELANPVVQGSSVSFLVPAGTTGNLYARLRAFGFAPGLQRGNMDRFSVYFDGDTEYAEIADSAALRPKNLTLEGWFNFANPTYTQVLLSKPLGSSVLNSYALWHDGNSLNGIISDSAGSVPALRHSWRPEAGKWHHLAYVFDDAANAHSLFIDGEMVATGAASRSISYDGHPLLIGAESDNERIAYFFRGSADEVRVWELARTAAEIRATRNLRLTGREAGLRAYWAFDEGSGSAISDESGNNPPGKLIKSPDWVPAALAFGRAGVASQYLLEARVQDAAGPAVTGVTLADEGGVQDRLVSRIQVSFNEELAGDFVSINRSLFARNGHAYLITPEAMSWMEAQALAASLGGRLAVIEDQAENDWVRSTFSFGGTYLWIGLSDRAQEGQFVWENNAANQFTAWAQNEPRDDGDEDFVAMNASGLWQDLREFGNYRAIIEFEGRDGDSDGLPDGIDPAPLSALNFFDLREAGRDGAFDTADDALYLAAPSDYSGGLSVDLLVLNGPLPPGKYRFTVSANLRDRSGNPLGTPLVRHFTVDARPGFITEPTINDSFAQAAPLAGSEGSLFGAFRIERGPGTGSGTYHIAGGDLNGDGLMDVIAPNYNAGSFDVLLGAADGSVKPFKRIESVSGPIDAELRDFNKDQKLDLALMSYSQNRMEVFFGKGDGDFTSAATYNIGSNSRRIASGDFDGDGHPDLAVANYSSRNLMVFFGSATGSFTAPVTIASTAHPWGLAAGDLNGDGRDDLLYATESTDQWAVMLGGAARAFQAGSTGNLPGGGRAAVLAELDGTPGLEAAIATQNGRVLVFDANAAGNLTEAHNLPYNTSDAYDLLAADLNNDGLADLAVASYGGQRVAILQQLAGFRFTVPLVYSVPGGPLSLLSGDFDKNGQEDLIVSLYNFNAVGYLMGVGAASLPEDPASPGLRFGGGRGTFTRTTDHDFWSFHARAGDAIQAAFHADTSAGALYGTLYGPNYTSIGSFSVGAGGIADSGMIVAPATGLYFVEVESSGNWPGEYALRATVVEPPSTLEKEPNGSINNASPLNVVKDGDSSRAFAAGYISAPNELDYFALGDLTAGSTVYLSARLAGGANPLIPVVALYDASNGYVVEADGGQAFDSVAEVPIARNGRYFALVRGAGTSSGLMGQYMLEARVAPAGSLSFPNLQVASITLPQLAQVLSGQSLNVRFTVRNAGAAPTGVANWLDRVILSANEFAGDPDDIILGSFPHAGALNPGASYEANASVRLPDGVQGSLYILVYADGGQQVSEFLFEGDNVRPSDGKLNVILPNYPDLVVEDLAAAFTETGPIQVTWKLANRGSGETPRAFKERIVLRNLGTGAIVGLPQEQDILQPLAAGGVLSRSLPIPRPPSGRYEVTVMADSGDDIFEFNANGHANAELNSFAAPFNLLLVNRAPTIAQVADQTVPEDGTLSIPLLVDDGETGAASVFVSAEAGNQALLPPALMSISGIGASRVLKLSPAPNLSGLTVVTVTASDGLLSSSMKFGLRVTPVNDIPTITRIGNVDIEEDTVSGAIKFTIDDRETDPAELTVRAESSNGSLLPASSIGLLGTGAARALVLKPEPDAFGQSTVTVRVSDGQQTATAVFIATVRPVNDPPEITRIPDLATRPGVAAEPLSFRIGDKESSATSLVLTKNSSNPALLPLDGIQLGGSGENRVVTLVPVANEKGGARVTITVADPQGETDTATFEFAVSDAALLITSHPESLAVADGARAEFAVKAAGVGTLRYQWFVNGEPKQGAVGSALVLDAAQFSDAGTYHVEVSDQNSTVKSREAKLRVMRGLAIEAQPVSRSVKAGASVAFSVKVSGAEPIEYQWLFNGNIIPNAASPTLLLPAVRGADSGAYSVRVRNPVGAVLSTAANLSVIEPLRFASEPEDLILPEGGTINLTAEAIGSALSFRWYFRGQPTAFTQPSLSIPNATRANSGEYRLEVRDPNGSIFSRAVRVLVVAPPVITKQPVSQTVAIGRSTKLSLIVSGTEPLDFEWFRNGAPVATTTLPVLEILNAGTDAAGSYTVRVSNIAGEVTSAPAVISVIEGVRIATQPASQVRRVGEIVVFAVEATGTGLSYRWYYRGVPIAGATLPTYTIASAQLNDSGSYGVEVSNAAGAVRSADANLRVQAAPVITKQPESVNALIGGGARITAGISGSDPLEIQWSFNGVEIPGATSPILLLGNLQPSQEGDYRVLARNSAGAVLSEAATLRIYSPVQIASQPQGGTIRAGAQLVLTVAATGSGPLSFQWQRNGFNVPGANSPTFAATLPGKYTVRVSNPAGGVLSDAVEVRVVQPVSFRLQPVAFTGRGGETVVLRVLADGSGILTYQWQRDGADIPGATDSTLILRNVAGAAAGRYRVLVSNEIGSEMSNEAVVAILDPPTILTQPLSQLLNIGANLSLSVTAEGAAPLSYQWSLNGAIIPGATSPTYALNNLQPTSIGNYAVTVSNPGGAVRSDIASISMQLPVIALADNRADAASQTAAVGVFRGSTLNATRETGEPDHAPNQPAAASVWFRWIAPVSGVVSFTTAGSSFDTILAAYTLNGQTLERQAADEDSGPFKTSTIQFNAVQGTTYFVVIDGYKGATGNIVIGWLLEQKQPKLPRIVTQPIGFTALINGAARFSVDAVSTDGNGLIYQWFFFNQPIVGQNSSVLNLANVQIGQVGAYSVSVSNATDPLFTVFSAPAQLQVNLIETQLEGPDVNTVDKPGAGNRPLLPQSIGSRPIRILQSVARGFTGSQVFSTVGSVRDESEPNHCNASGGASSWSLYEAPANGSLQITTDGSAFDTVLAVYGGSPDSFDSLVLIGCDNNSGADGLDSRMLIPVTAGQLYFIVVDGVNGASGIVQLNYSLSQPPVFTQQPNVSGIQAQATNRVVPEGSKVTLSVTATNLSQSAQTYAWRFNGVPLTGGTNSTYIINSAQPTNAGNYTVTVENFAGATQSETLVLEVLSPVSIVTAPQDQTVPLGGSAVFSVAANGTAPIAYQWSLNGTPIPGATSASLALNNVQAGGAYQVRVSNAANALTNQAVLNVLQPVTITQQPSSVAVALNGSATLNVAATGSGTLGYQWRFNGVNLAGQTSSSLQLQNLTPQNGGTYSVLVSNSVSSVISVGAEVSVTVPVAIVQQPRDQAISGAGTTQFEVIVSGSEPITYQWRFNGNPIAGASSRVLVLTNLTPAQAGSYSVVVNNAAGVPVTSASAVLTLTAPPSISQQPQSQSVSVGGAAVFNVTASGSGTLNYQWRFNGVHLAGQTGPTLALNNLTLAQAGEYSVAIDNNVGSIVSAAAVLMVNSPVTIVQQPFDVEVIQGGQASFNVLATGTGPIRYQWLKNDQPIAGATNEQFVIPSVLLADSGTYRAVVSNAASTNTSEFAFLIVGAVPQIVTPPQPVVVNNGSPASFSVVATGSAPLSFQWRFNGVPMAQQTNATLQIASAGLANEGDYSVLIVNAAGVVSSGLAALSINRGDNVTLGASIQNNEVVVLLTGPAGRQCDVEFSANLQSWTPGGTVTLTGGQGEFRQAIGAGGAFRFYRAQLRP